MTTQAISSVLFCLFALVAVIAAIAAVSTVRILRAAVYLMVVLLSTAALYACLGAEFIAGLQILVYVGGIVVLLVFAVMLTHTNELVEPSPSIGRRVAALVGSVLFTGTSWHILSTAQFKAAVPGANASASPAALGRSFLDYGASGYALPFEVISLLLLAAIIGGIVIARKQEPAKEGKL